MNNLRKSEYSRGVAAGFLAFPLVFTVALALVNLLK